MGLLKTHRNITANGKQWDERPGYRPGLEKALTGIFAAASAANHMGEDWGGISTNKLDSAPVTCREVSPAYFSSCIFFQQKCLINSLLQRCCLIDTGHKGVGEVLSSVFPVRYFKFRCCRQHLGTTFSSKPSFPGRWQVSGVRLSTWVAPWFGYTEQAISPCFNILN